MHISEYKKSRNNPRYHPHWTPPYRYIRYYKDSPLTLNARPRTDLLNDFAVHRSSARVPDSPLCSTGLLQSVPYCPYSSRGALSRWRLIPVKFQRTESLSSLY